MRYLKSIYIFFSVFFSLLMDVFYWVINDLRAFSFIREIILCNVSCKYFSHIVVDTDFIYGDVSMKIIYPYLLLMDQFIRMFCCCDF